MCRLSQGVKRMENNLGPWKHTISGERFYFLRPEVNHYRIEDIAHALSMLCRFGGHVKEFYSVAQHSVLVSNCCRPEFAKIGLLHDATEAYIGDMVGPLKGILDNYRDIETGIRLHLNAAFSIPFEFPDNIHEVDKRMCVTEALSLQTSPDWCSDFGFMPFDFNIIPMDPKVAMACFLTRYNDLAEA